jgi:LuxR family maltose regulon positive regulatory protein
MSSADDPSQDRPEDDRSERPLLDLAETIGQAVRAGNAELAAGLIEQNYIRLIMDGRSAELLGWLETLPPELVRARSRLSLAHAWSLGYAGAGERLEQALRWVEGGLGDMPWLSEAGAASWARDAVDNAMRGELLALRAIMVSRRYESCRAIEYAQEAIWLLWPGQPADLLLHEPADRLPPQELWLRVVILIALGNAYCADGNVQAAEPIYREAIRLSMGEGARPVPRLPMFALVGATRLGQVLATRGRLHEAEWVYRHALAQARRLEGEPPLFSGETLIRLGGLLIEQDHLQQAASEVHSGLALCRRSGDVTGELAGHLAEGRLAYLLGDTRRAGEALERAAGLAGRDPDSYVRTRVDAVVARLDLWMGDLPAAERWALRLHEQRPKRRDFPRAIEEMEYLVLARIRLAQGRAADADCVLGQVLDAAEPAGRGGVAVEALALQALARAAEGDAEPARESLQRALALGGPEGYVRTFLDEGEPMRRLLEELVAREQSHPPQDRSRASEPVQYAEDLLRRFGPAGPGE